MDFAGIFSENIQHALMITSFVLVMMFIIEFINVYSKGRFSYNFKKKPLLQILFAAVLGAIPGCLGTYAIVSLYTHHVVGIGALLAAMISSTGDEAFLMLTMIPNQSIILFLILFLIALIAGYITFLFEKRKANVEKVGFSVHHQQKNECITVKWKSIYLNLRFITFRRATLIVLLLIFITGLLLGAFDHIHGNVEIPHGNHTHTHSDHSSWITITFLVLSFIALMISVLSTNHFLDHHLWKHIIKVHSLRIFLWIFGTLILISILTNIIHVDQWVQTNKMIIMVFALIIGIIPASGPHIIFITLFFNGAIPFSVLLVNSIMQDGHGALPLFAESKKSFVLIKAIKIPIALAIGIILNSIGI